MKKPWPQSVTAAVTDRCNLRCVMCFQAVADRAAFTDATWQHPERVAFFLQRAKLVALHGQGEPLLYPRLKEVLRGLRHENYAGFCTNGQALTERNAELILRSQVGWLDFSIDAGTERTYHRLRGGSWEKLWRNIDRLRLMRGREKYPHLLANMCLCRENGTEIADLIPYLAARKFQQLHIFHLNPLPEAKHGSWEVPFHDGEGAFRYYEQDPLAPDFRKFHDEAVGLACAEARRCNLPLLASGEFQGQTGSYRRIA